MFIEFSLYLKCSGCKKWTNLTPQKEALPFEFVSFPKFWFAKNLPTVFLPHLRGAWKSKLQSHHIEWLHKKTQRIVATETVKTIMWQ